MAGRRALIVQNIGREGPGLIALALEDRDIGYDIIDVSREMRLPDSLGRYGCVFMMGGPESANDATASMGERLELARTAIGAGIPFLGVCLGMQMAVRACGGAVHKALAREVGWKDPVSGSYFEIELTAQGRSDPLFNGLGNRLKIFHLHGETVRLSGRMALLATGRTCTNQVIRIGERAYGIQGHLELTGDMLDAWIKEDPDLRLLSRKALESDYRAVKDEYESSGSTILSNFLKAAGFGW